MQSEQSLHHLPRENRQTVEREVVRRRQYSVPVDVQAIAEDLGINVWSWDMGPDVSGMLARQSPPDGGRSGYAIYVNNQHHPNRMRFTIAHEIAHFILHRDESPDTIRDDQFYRALSNPLEAEANRLAAEILMPWHLVNELTSQGVTSLDELASRMQVSKQAMAIRLGIPYDQTWE
ncbi:MAG: ImmA/IrrE family metallo-endopeptidase [Hyphomicrobiales bacterium]|nr:ImmA/IrrE family metallo-endopeptidase [Hyphomicrobiales bacterium]